MAELGVYVASKSKRGRPRKLTIFQTESLIQEGILEPKKPLTKKQLYEEEHGVSWEFAQKNPEYMKKVEDYIIRRELRRKNRFSKTTEIVKKLSRGRPRKNIIFEESTTLKDSDNINLVKNVTDRDKDTLKISNDIDDIHKKIPSKTKLYYLHNNEVLEIKVHGLLVKDFNLNLCFKIQNKLLNLKKLYIFKTFKKLNFWRIYRSGYSCKRIKNKVFKNLTEDVDILNTAEYFENRLKILKLFNINNINKNYIYSSDSQQFEILLEEKLKNNKNSNLYQFYNKYLEKKNKLVKNIKEFKIYELENLKIKNLNRYIDGLDSTMENVIEIDNKIKLLNIQIKAEIEISKNFEKCDGSDSDSDSDLNFIKKKSVYDPKEIIEKTN